MAAKQPKLQIEGGSPEQHLVYKKMVWGMLLTHWRVVVIYVSLCFLIVSVALKCHFETGAVTSSVADIWSRHLVQVCSLLSSAQ